MNEVDLIVAKSHDTILITDAKGIILNVSPNFYAIYGRDPSQLIGVSVYQLQDEKVFSPSICALVLEHKKEMQVMQKTASGSFVMAKAVPLFDHNNELVKVISFSDDFSGVKVLSDEYKNLQEQMVKKNQNQSSFDNKSKYGVPFISKAIGRVFDLLQRIAVFETSIMLLGESGSGKTLFANKVHEMSRRHKGRIIEVSCGAIPENLFESEFFGYEAGAFTGASKEGKLGLIEQAHQGTLFLDEVSELPMLMQTKLLKVLQDKKLTRIGGIRERYIDFRLVSASNKNLDTLVAEGKFRLDLYYRLNVIPVKIPPLRDHKEDIPLLTEHFLLQLNQRYQQDKSIDPMLLVQFVHYHWPGNIRQLKNILERLYVTSLSNVLEPDHSILEVALGSQPPLPSIVTPYIENRLLLPEAMAQLEKKILQQARAQYSTTYAMAKSLGISQPSVVRKLKKHHL